MSSQDHPAPKFKWPCTCLVEKKYITMESVDAVLREFLSLYPRNVECASLEACNEYVSVGDKFRGSWSVELIFPDHDVLTRPDEHFQSILNSLQATVEGFFQNKVKVRVVCDHEHECHCPKS